MPGQEDDQDNDAWQVNAGNTEVFKELVKNAPGVNVVLDTLKLIGAEDGQRCFVNQHQW
jgi:hypothetical protein